MAAYMTGGPAGPIVLQAPLATLPRDTVPAPIASFVSLAAWQNIRNAFDSAQVKTCCGTCFCTAAVGLLTGGVGLICCPCIYVCIATPVLDDECRNLNRRWFNGMRVISCNGHTLTVYMPPGLRTQAEGTPGGGTNVVVITTAPGPLAPSYNNNRPQSPPVEAQVAYVPQGAVEATVISAENIGGGGAEAPSPYADP
eukprot:CAMPEP_0198429894 /NCGR_PEP_ID=MMETSP1452-20131203/10272_1 /TAXON_ID=1181717 /ORGANISM="Synchroma pusillum, Strain CCMP3072" /LENGTH=196 /DNA_ID=CAMNT_0044150315 /DNA_START=60 /DNA_END=647 /DNA_ORIENTATION=+